MNNVSPTSALWERQPCSLHDIVAWSALLPALASYLFNDSGGRGQKGEGVTGGGGVMRDNITSYCGVCGMYTSCVASYPWSSSMSSSSDCIGVQCPLHLDSISIFNPVLDMAQHVPLYLAVFAVVLSLSRQPRLVGLLLERPFPGKTKKRASSIFSLMERMKSTAEQYQKAARWVPVLGVAVPVVGVAVPVVGVAVPVVGVAVPVVGVAVPVVGVAVPVVGVAVPVVGVAVPVVGVAIPVAGVAIPVAGVAIPVAGVAIPVAGVAVPVVGVAVPVVGVAVPVVGVVVPVGVFGPIFHFFRLATQRLPKPVEPVPSPNSANEAEAQPSTEDNDATPLPIPSAPPLLTAADPSPPLLPKGLGLKKKVLKTRTNAEVLAQVCR